MTLSSQPHPAALPAVLTVIAMAPFAASLSSRALDPLLPHIAGEFNVTIATAAGLSAGFAFTFAIVQPVLGAAADVFGKVRLMTICLLLLAFSNILGAFATSYSLLFATRILGGIASGGVFPVAMSLVSDVVAPERRQIGLSRTLAGAMTGNLLGASASGLIGDWLGWRGVMASLGAAVVFASFAVAIGFYHTRRAQPPRNADFGTLRRGYRTIFANPNALICFSAVFIEGLTVFGLFPFIAAFLFEDGETRLAIAGLVIAGFATGGLFYTLSVSRLLPRLGIGGMMIAGAMLAASQLVVTVTGPHWPLQFASFIGLGWGFYMLHGSLQVFATELSSEARATALALHSFFFFAGQTAGPIAYGFLLSYWGKPPTLLIAAATLIALGPFCARFLKQMAPADA